MKFTAEDFNFDAVHENHYCDPSPQDLADRANARLAEMLKDAPTVFSHAPLKVWCEVFPIRTPTHSAKLVCVEEVK